MVRTTSLLGISSFCQFVSYQFPANVCLVGATLVIKVFEDDKSKGFSCLVRSISISISILLVRKKENTMIILGNPQIAELIEAGCAFKSNVIISKNETIK